MVGSADGGAVAKDGGLPAYDVQHYLRVLHTAYVSRLRKAFREEDFQQLFRSQLHLGCSISRWMRLNRCGSQRGMLKVSHSTASPSPLNSLQALTDLATLSVADQLLGCHFAKGIHRYIDLARSARYFSRRLLELLHRYRSLTGRTTLLLRR